MRVISTILLTVLICFLSACSTVKPIQIQDIEVQKPALELPAPAPIELKNVQWFVATPDNMIEVFKEIQKDYNVVLFGLTDKGYENLSLNMEMIKNYMIKQKKIIQAYKEYYEENSNSSD